MKRSWKITLLLSFAIVASANALFAQPYAIDENGHGYSTNELFLPPLAFPLSSAVAPDPTGGILTSPVLIYSLGSSVVPGDVALIGSDGTIADLLRFFTPPGSGSEVIFYSRAGGGSLADVGIPVPNNPVLISAVSPVTVWTPFGQPGGGIVAPVSARFQYYIGIAEVPEPSLAALLLISTGVWMGIRHSRRNGVGS